MHEYGDYGTLRQLVSQFLERSGSNNFPRYIEKNIEPWHAAHG